MITCLTVWEHLNNKWSTSSNSQGERQTYITFFFDVEKTFIFDSVCDPPLDLLFSTQGFPRWMEWASIWRIPSSGDVLHFLNIFDKHIIQVDKCSIPYPSVTICPDGTTHWAGLRSLLNKIPFPQEYKDTLPLSFIEFKRKKLQLEEYSEFSFDDCRNMKNTE